MQEPVEITGTLLKHLDSPMQRFVVGSIQTIVLWGMHLTLLVSGMAVSRLYRCT